VVARGGGVGYNWFVPYCKLFSTIKNTEFIIICIHCNSHSEVHINSTQYKMSKQSHDDETSSSPDPPSLLCSTASSTTPTTLTTASHDTQQQNEKQIDYQQVVVPQSPLQTNNNVCDDTSYFDKEWVSNTVQSAVTNLFFGVDDNNNISSKSGENNEGEKLEEGESSVPSSRGVSPINNANSGNDTPENNDKERCKSVPPSSTCESDNIDQPFLLTTKARSISPSFSLFCGQVESNDSTDSNTIEHNEKNENQEIDDQQSAATHFDPSDFNSQTWLTAIQETSATIRYSAPGVAALTAVLVVHPLALIGTVATASAAAGTTALTMWAVGFFHELDKGYQIWSEEFGLLFWEDSDKINNSSSGGLKMICAAPNSIDDTDATSVSSVATALDHERHKLGEKVVVVKVDEESGKVTPQKKSRKGKLTETDDGISKPLKKGYGLRRIKSAPISVKSSTSKKQHGKQQSALVSNSKPPSIPTKPKIKKQASTASASSSTSANSKLIDEHFPPLEICVIQSVELPYLNTTQQFFDVFFADDAPYSFRDFQKKRGDVDIVYGKWKDCSSSVGSETEDTLDSIFPPLPPRSSAKQRKQKFSTLTKSYFGPAYAKASKMQRATQLANGKILVLENVTQLSDIPFANRFQVMERWVLEVVPEEEVSKKSQSTDNNTTLHTATCKLTVYAEVQMLKSCSWEPQIRKKASETFTEVVTDWCKSARKALKATEEQKQKRLRLSKEATNNTTITKRQVSPVLLKLDATQTPAVAKQAELFAKHKRNFDQLDQLISIGDLEWCSVEVMHSPRHNSLDKSTTFSTVLEYPSLNEYEITSSNTGEDEDDNGKSSSPSKARVIMRRKSKKLFKRLSSRVINKSSQKH